MALALNNPQRLIYHKTKKPKPKMLWISLFHCLCDFFYPIRRLHAILNKSWKQHQIKQKVYNHLPPITQIIQIKWLALNGHHKWSKDKLISNFLLWTLIHEHTNIGQSTTTYIHQLSTETTYNQKDLPRTIANRDRWQEIVKGILSAGTPWW